jgi:hypothetical protein
MRALSAAAKSVKVEAVVRHTVIHVIRVRIVAGIKAARTANVLDRVGKQGPGQPLIALGLAKVTLNGRRFIDKLEHHFDLV